LLATKASTLKEQALLFQEQLAGIKAQTPLDPRVTWYPWQSLSQLGVLDTFLQGDVAALMHMIGRDPALDVGCGAGLLCEPLARLGAAVTGIDAAAENIAAAHAHALQSGLSIDYRTGGIEGLGSQRFDLVTSLEVIEHVTDPAAFIAGLSGALADGGLLVLSTPNRTALSHLAMITIGEGTGQIPKGTHDWNKFLTPDELGALLEEAGLKVIDTRGLSFSPARGFVISDDMKLDYFVTAVRK